MSCHKPLLAIPTQDITKSGKRKYVPIGSYERFKDDDPMVLFPGSIKIPCGQCTGCRMQKTREWADRMILELDHSKKAVFLTLTYNNDHLPVKCQVTTGQIEMTLQKRDLTLFFKRLRKRFKDREIRYYAVGEYGKNTDRPHYHVILFGLELSDFEDLQRQGNNEFGQIYYKSDLLAESIWKLGFCCISEVSWKTCAYVARYVQKKNYGLVSDEFVERCREPEYSVMSRNPGIGMYYPIEHEDCFANNVKYFGDQDGVTKVRIPSSLLRYLYNTDRVKFEELKNERQKFSHDTELTKLLQTDLSAMELNDLYEKNQKFSEKVIDYYRGL